MKTTTYLGKTQIKVKRVGFGGIPIQRLTTEESDRVIAKAVEAGIDFFDTSRMYSDSEEKLGRVLKDYRDRVTIADKSYTRTGPGILADIETGLRLLHTDHIDLYQCHNVSSPQELDQILAPGGALEGIEKARQEGKVRYIGISGHKPALLMKALEAFPFDTVQVPLNVVETGALEALIPLAKQREIGIIAMKPMGGGAFKNPVLSLRFILSNGADVAIPGMDHEDQVAENLSALDHAAPPDEKELEILEAEKKELGEHFCRRCEYCLPCPEGLPISFLHTLSAYFFRYHLEDWAWERITALEKAYKDCTACGECTGKCPYRLDNPRIFEDTWEKLRQARG